MRRTQYSIFEGAKYLNQKNCRSLSECDSMASLPFLKEEDGLKRMCTVPWYNTRERTRMNAPRN